MRAKAAQGPSGPRNGTPGLTWLLGVLIVALLVGAGAQLLADSEAPVIETTVTSHEVLPDGQAEVTGTIDGFVAEDAVGAPLAMPVDLDAGGATIEGALVDGARSTIVWDGGRPFHLEGSGTIDLGPTRVEMGVGAVFWHLDGLRILTPGDYRLATPVAVGSDGLATPRDTIDFRAGDDTTIETRGDALVGRGLPVHLEGPGTFTAEGRFTIRTRDGTTEATRIEFGPGSFLVDIDAEQTITAVFNGPLRSDP